jgi:hypothetical protein
MAVSPYAARMRAGQSDSMAGFTTDETLRREHAAAAAERAQELEAEGGKRRLRRGLLELTRTMNSEEARQRSKYLDRRIREAAGLFEPVGVREVVATEAENCFKRGHENSYWDSKLITKRKSEPRHLGGKPTP